MEHACRQSGDAWPCYLKKQWREETCGHCDDHGYCTKETRGEEPMAKPCLCQQVDPFCVFYDKVAKMLNLWEYFGGILEDESRIIEALGFEVAIVTRAKENVLFAMGELSEAQRQGLSHQKRELVTKCSFNGKECDIDKDFLLVSDPTFGNCFTFNHNRSDVKSSVRAGPMYGLRVALYVNASDYLPTTEAVGVRLTIHDKDDRPFPDSFGYSAPTGYISSFGMRMQKMSRLPAPYGDCVSDGKSSQYIYQDYKYSTEGCYRSCFQDLVVRECGCGDPRFPTLPNNTHCLVFNPEQRSCLNARTNELSHVHSSFRCRCQQPCDQVVYTVSYSEAIWPSKSLNVSIGKDCDLSPDECNEIFEENGAMVEVFYETLNFEALTESEAYGVVKMLADFGGQLGLWSGVSFMTICEFVCLGLELLYMIIAHKWKRRQLRRWEAEREQKLF